MDLTNKAEIKRAKARERQRKRRANLSEDEKRKIRIDDASRHKKRLEDVQFHAIQKTRVLLSQKARLADPAERAVHLNKISEAQRIRLSVPDHRAIHLKRISEAQRIRLADPEHRAIHLNRISEAQRIRLEDPDHRAIHLKRISEAQRIRLADTDHRALHLKRISEAQRIRLTDPAQRNIHMKRLTEAQRIRLQDPAERRIHVERTSEARKLRLADPIQNATHRLKSLQAQKRRLQSHHQLYLHRQRALAYQTRRLFDLEERKKHVARVIQARTHRRRDLKNRKEFLTSIIPSILKTAAQMFSSVKTARFRQLCMKKFGILWAEFVGMSSLLQCYTPCVRKVLQVSRVLGKDKNHANHRMIIMGMIQELLLKKLSNVSMSYIRSRFKDFEKECARNFHVYDAVVSRVESIQTKLQSSISLSATSAASADISTHEIISIGGLHVHRKDIDQQHNLNGCKTYRTAAEVFGDAAKQARSALHGVPMTSPSCTDQDVLLESDSLHRYALGDENCPAFPSAWPSSIKSMTERICTAPLSHMDDILLKLSQCSRCTASRCEPAHIDKCSDLQHSLYTLSICYSHVRTIKRIIEEVFEYASWIRRFRKFRSIQDFGGMSSLCNLLLPRLIKIKHPPVDVYDESQHFQSCVLAKYGSQINAFLEEEKNIAIFDCFSCRRMFKRTEVIPMATTVNCITNIFTQSQLHSQLEILLCKECRKSIKKNEMPLLCFRNGLDFDEIPPELSSLNFIELACIRIIRPFMNMVQLSPLSSRGQGHFGYEGTVLLLPSSPAETISHVLKSFETLPSPQNLRLNVIGGKCGSWKTICRFNKVLRAVQWLKKHNDIYSNIRLTTKRNFDELMTEYDLGAIGQTGSQSNASNSSVLPTDNIPSSDCHVITQITPIALAPRDPLYTAGSSIEKYKTFEAVRNAGKSTDVLQKDVELSIFPHIFVKGRYGLNYPRQKKVSDTKYIRLLLMHRDRRFADKELLFYLHDRKDKKHVRGCMFFQSTKKIGTREMREIIQNGENVDDSISSMFSNLKTHESYWKRVRSDLAATIRYFGPPTWFVTLNPSEREWEPLRDLYKCRHPHVDFSNIHNLTVMDTVLFCRYFYDRIRNCFRNLLMGENGVLGHGVHYWLRNEYQNRGTDHTHAFIWIKDAPFLNDSRFTDSDLITFIDRYITTRIPDAAFEPEAHRLVDTYMQHKCTSTCTTKKKKNLRALSSCRFGYPLPVTSSTKLVSEDEKKKNPNLRSYLLRRSTASERINAYSLPLLLAWRANIDVQFIGEGSSAILNYVTSYVGKAENKNTLNGEEFGKQLPGASLQEYASLALRSRQLGLPEVTDHLMGHPAHQSSASVLFLNRDAEESRTRVLKPFESLEESRDTDSATLPNLLDIYYPSRPVELESCSLFHFAYNFRIVKKLNKVRNDDDDDAALDLENDTKDSVTSWLSEKGFNVTSEDSPLYRRRSGAVYTLQNGHGYAIVRNKGVLIKYFMPAAAEEHEEALEDNYRRYLLLFKPFRIEANLRGDFNSHRSSLGDFLSVCSSGARDSINKLIDLDKKNSTSIISAREQRVVLNDMVEEDEDGVDVQQVDFNSTCDLGEIESTLNQEQLDAFRMILSNLDQQERKEPFKNAIIAGIAGCGKSHLISAITKAVQFRYQNSSNHTVIICAPTGLAAMNVNGGTVHSVFNIEVEKRKTPGLRSLSGAKLENMRGLFREVRLIIVDECSMLSNIMLWKINLRCQEISGEFGKPFGGYLLLLFGDLLQLPPVRLAPVYEVLSSSHARSIFGTTTFGFHLWRASFDYRELIQNMRQKGDSAFADLLKRFRLGILTTDDIRTINDRRIEKLLGKGPPFSGATLNDVVAYYQMISAADSKTLCVFGKTACVQKTNISIMEHRECADRTLIIETIKAFESEDMRTVKSGSKVWLRRGIRLHDVLKNRNTDQLHCVNDETETPEQTKLRGGLPKHLKLQIGCRIMLLRNVSPKEKLVNGVLGQLISFVRDSENHVIQLEVKFDHVDSHVFVQRQKTVYEINPKMHIVRVRRQFPVCVAFAVTIHKCQGQTLDNVIVDLSTSFSPGQMYVAASRTKTLSGLHVMNFEPQVIKVSRSAILEYNRQRELINMDLLPLPNPGRNIKCDWDRRFLGLEETPNKRNGLKSRRNTKERTSKFTEDSSAEPSRQRLRIEDDTHLRLRNSGTDCCFNSTIQALRVLRSLERVTSNNDIWSNIIRLRRSNGRNDIGSMREDLHFDHRQQCVSEIVQKCVEELNITDKQLFSFAQTVEVRCHSCHNWSTRADPDVVLRLPDRTVTSVANIENALLNYIAPEQNLLCTACGAATQEERTILDLSSTEVLVVQLPLFSNNQRRDIQFNGQSNASVSFMNIPWKIMAGIVHEGNTPLAGHYWTVTNTGANRWTKCNDALAPRTTIKFPKKILGVYLIFLEKQH